MFSVSLWVYFLSWHSGFHLQSKDMRVGELATINSLWAWMRLCLSVVRQPCDELVTRLGRTLARSCEGSNRCWFPLQLWEISGDRKWMDGFLTLVPCRLSVNRSVLKKIINFLQENKGEKKLKTLTLKQKERPFANRVKSLPVEHLLSWALHWRLMSLLTSLNEVFYSLQTFTGPLTADVIYCLLACCPELSRSGFKCHESKIGVQSQVCSDLIVLPFAFTAHVSL